MGRHALIAALGISALLGGCSSQSQRATAQGKGAPEIAGTRQGLTSAVAKGTAYHGPAQLTSPTSNLMDQQADATPQAAALDPAMGGLRRLEEGHLPPTTLAHWAADGRLIKETRYWDHDGYRCGHQYPVQTYMLKRGEYVEVLVPPREFKGKRIDSYIGIYHAGREYNKPFDVRVGRDNLVTYDELTRPVDIHWMVGEHGKMLLREPVCYSFEIQASRFPE